MDFGPALTSLGLAIEAVKVLRSLDKELDQAELKLRLAEVSGGLADANIALAEAQTEIKAMEAEIERLRSEFARRADTIEHRGARYLKGPNGRPQGYAFCPRCEEVDGRLMHTQRSPRGGRQTYCPECKTEYSLTRFDWAAPNEED